MITNKYYHIDTLYLSYVCDYTEYNSIQNALASKTFLYYRDGRHWFDYGYCVVGILDWDVVLSSCNYPFTIEYKFEYLYTADLVDNHKSIKLPFNSSFDKYLIKRLDYNITFQSKSTIMDSLFVSQYFQKGNDWWGKGREYESRYLGKRTTGKVFRIYNKTIELQDHKNFIKQDMIKKVFGSLNDLYTIEVELLRKYIIGRTKTKGTLEDFEHVLDIAKTLLASVKYCDNTPSNISKLKNNNHKRIKYQTILNYVGDVEFLPVLKYDKSRFNMLSKIETILNSYNDYDGEKLSHRDLAKYIANFEDIKEHNGK